MESWHELIIGMPGFDPLKALAPFAGLTWNVVAALQTATVSLRTVALIALLLDHMHLPARICEPSDLSVGISSAPVASQTH